jgi:hypothetical protein
MKKPTGMTGIIAMVKLFCASLFFSIALVGSAPAKAQAKPFACRLLETEAFLPELQTFSGYRWIECLVVGPAVAEVEGVAVNNGKCQTFDYWYAGRSFARGEAIYIPYACMTPVNVTISANGLFWPVTLR